MSNIYTSADQLIGKTPLLELTHIEKAHDLKAKIVAKLEYFNPAGSVKDRIAKAMIDDAEAKGLFFKGRDVDVMTAAFKEFSAKTVKQKEQPSIRHKLDQEKAQSKAQHKEKVKVKTKDRGVEL